MAKVIFMHFDEKTDGIYDAKIGEPVVRLAKEKGIPIAFDKDHSKCLVSVEHISDEEPTSYMEDEELDELVKLDYNIGILSNKPHEFTLAYAKSLFSKYNIPQIHGQKSDVPKKPDPSAAIMIANSFNNPCEKTYFVGDTMVDMQTAVNAKMIGIGVLWGFRDEEELLTNGADFIVKHPLDILEIVNN